MWRRSKKNRHRCACEILSGEVVNRVGGMNVLSVCARLGMSRQNYYQKRRQRQRRQVDEELVVELVLRERRLQDRLGGRKVFHLIKAELVKAGVKMGRDRFFEVLDSRDLLLVPLKSQWPRTTSSSHYLPVFENRIKNLKIEGPNEVWVSDLTYVRTEEGFMYLALITDKFSRKIVGYDIDDTLEVIGSIRALDRAIRDLPAGAIPIHHSDRGSQYCCHEYVQKIKNANLSMSMTEHDHCAENAMAERMNGILKQEYGLGAKLKTKALARTMASNAVHLYNTRRPHRELNMDFPGRVHTGDRQPMI
jgi:putative transposase